MPTPEAQPNPQQTPLAWFAHDGRAPLVRRIRRRIGGQLGQVLDPEDVLQESLLTAVRVSEGRWEGSRGALAVFLAKVAELRLRHEGRRARVRRAQTLTSEPIDVRPEEGSAGRAGRNAGSASVRGLLSTASPLRREHCWSLFLQEWMDSPWTTSGFLMDRPTDGAMRSLHHRARAELTEQVRRGS